VISTLQISSIFLAILVKEKFLAILVKEMDSNKGLPMSVGGGTGGALKKLWEHSLSPLLVASSS
jgi:hypothetical protein